MSTTIEEKIADVYDEAARNLMFNLRNDETEAVELWKRLCFAMHACWPELVEALEKRGTSARSAIEAPGAEDVI